MTDDIFAARDRLVGAFMAEMDLCAEAMRAKSADGNGAFLDVMTGDRMLECAKECGAAKIAYWEIVRGEKWPA